MVVVDQPAVLEHETAEGVEKRAFGRPPRVDPGRLDNPQLSEVRQKHPSPGHGMAVLADLLPCHASTAAAEVSPEGLHGPVIQVLKGVASAFSPGAQVAHNS
jgi:hypothetical protein